MKFLFLAGLISSLPSIALATGVCNVKVNITESPDGFIYSGSVKEQPEGTQDFQYLDDDGMLTMNGTYLAVLSSNNVYAGGAKVLKISENEKKRLIDASNLMIKYSENIIKTYSSDPDNASAVKDAQGQLAGAKTLSAYASGLKAQVKPEEFYATVGKFLETERSKHFYKDLKRPNLENPIQFCTAKVRCPCSEINWAGIRDELCLSDYTKPKPRAEGECSYVNYSFDEGGSSKKKDASATQAVKQ